MERGFTRTTKMVTIAKDVLPNINRTQAVKITPAVTEWSRLLLCDVVCSERVTVCHATERTIRSLPRVTWMHSAFLTL